MRTIFIDTLYWIALFNPKDQWHQAATQTRRTLGPFRGITTTSVLTEVANYFSAFGPAARSSVIENIRDILGDSSVETVPEQERLFYSALTLYETRLDKQYSLTDCISMVLMRERNLFEVLTHDRHFAQEGFTILL